MELTPVFESMLANATRLCEANFGALNLYDNGSFPLAAAHNAPEAYVEYRRHHPIVKAGSRHPLARVAASKQVLQVADMRAEPLYLEKDPSFTAMADMASLERCSLCQCSRTMSRLAQLRFSGGKCGRSPINRSSWCRTLPPKQ